MKSGSSMVKAQLLKMAEGDTFDTETLWQSVKVANPGETLTINAVSGFLSKCVDNEALTYVDRGKVRIFTIASLKAIEDMTVRGKAGIGSLPGRGDGPHRSRRRPTVADLSERLFQIAADLEKVEPQLAAVSTEALLKELARRTTERQVV